MSYKALLNKYKGMSVQVKVVFWFTFAGFLQRGISVITTPIFTRILTTEQYGLFSVYNAWSSVLVIIATLDLHMAVMNNAFMKVDTTKEHVVSAFQGLSFCTSLLFLAVYLFFNQAIDEIIGLPFIVNLGMFVSFIFIPPYNYWLIYKRHAYDYKKMTFAACLIAILTPACGLTGIFMVSSHQGEVRILSRVFALCAVGIFFMAVNWRKDRAFFDWKVWKYGLVFNLPLIPHFLSEILLNESDRIMINMFVGSSEAGIYSIAYSAASLVQIFSIAVNTAMVPWQYEKLREKNYSAMGRPTYYILCGLGGASAMFIILAPEIVRILAGRDYAHAVYLIPTLAASVYFNYLYQILARVEMYYGKRIYTVIATAVATILNIVINYLFILRCGYIVAGYSTLLSHVLLCVMHYLFYRKVCRKYIDGRRVYSMRIIILISIAMLMVAAVMTILYNYLTLRIGSIIIFFILLVFFRKRIFEIIRQIKN